MGTFSDMQIFKMLSGVGNGLARAKGVVLSAPITFVENWQRCYAKARLVKSSERGSSRGAVRSHVRYLQHKDSHEHDDKLVDVIGDLGMVREWDDGEQHYRLIIAPERGDVLDMTQLAHDTCRLAFKRYGFFRYAGSVHEKRQSNGRLNRHIHLVFKDRLGLGANSIKRFFSTIGSRCATIQFERKGLQYMSHRMSFIQRHDIQHFRKELYMGDNDGLR